MKAYDKAFNALGDPTRRFIFQKLRQKPLAVVDIADGLEVSRPAVSQHLKVLREAKLISLLSYGSKNIYQIEKAGVLAMISYLDTFWDKALNSFKKTAEQTEKKLKNQNRDSRYRKRT